jgi:hypothetical protein
LVKNIDFKKKEEKISKKNHRTDRNQCDGKKESSNEAYVNFGFGLDIPK